MEPEEARRVREIFESTLALDPEARKVYLAEIYAEDASAHAEVIQLLDAHEHGHELLDMPALAHFATAGASDNRTELAPGLVLADRFVIAALLGRGGMGEVYEATDNILQRKVALKILVQHGIGASPQRGKLQTEARALAALRHPSICALHDVCSHDGRDFLVMEFLEGETLAARLRRQGRLPADELVLIARDICEALQFAHQLGILHRDLKPANIMLGPNGGAKLLDFGIATLLSTQPEKMTNGISADHADPAVTETITDREGLVGTPQYMSPEQVLGETLDARTDIFSLGVVLYEMATGSGPFRGNTTTEVLNSILQDQPPPIRRFNRDMPVLLERVIATCLEKPRERRYASAAAVKAALREIAVSDHSSATDFRPGSKTLAWGAAAFFSMLIAVTVYFSIDLRSAVHLTVDRTDAIRLARHITDDLGYSLTGLREKVTFSFAVELERVIRHYGMGTARQLVRSGRGLAWEIEFIPDWPPTAAIRRNPGISLRIGTSGELLEFQAPSLGPVAALTGRDALEKKIQPVLDRFLRFTPVRPPDLTRGQGGHWRVPVGSPGWQEEVDVVFCKDRISMNRRVVTPDTFPNPNTHSPTAAGLALIVTSYSILLIILLYVYGIWIFLGRRRFVALSWRIPIIFSLSGWLLIAWLSASYEPWGSRLGIATILDRTLLIFLLLLPASSGLYLSLRHKDPVRLVALEQLLHAKLGKPGVGIALMDGVLGGGVLAGVYLFESAGLQSVIRMLTYFHMAFLGESAWKTADVGLAFGSAAITIAVLTTYHRVKLAIRKEWLALIASSLLLGSWFADMTSRRDLIDISFGASAVACQLLLYRTSGLAAVVCANLTSRLLVAGIVSVSIGNTRFVNSAIVMLTIPVALLCVGVLSTRLSRTDHRVE